jgi:threonine synthase
VPDQETSTAEPEVAKLEGLLTEPASSGIIQNLKNLGKESAIDKDVSVVRLIIGSELKATNVL